MGNKREVVYVERKQSHGLLYFLLFGWWYVAWVVLKWVWRVITWPFRAAARVGWDVIVKWPFQASKWLWMQGARGSKALTARYGAKGWAVVAGVVIVLAILGSLTSGS